jgi:hypothetical protein
MVNEEKSETPTTQNINAGDKPQELGKIERAELAVKRMEEAEKRLDDKIAKLTELETNRLLGGSAGGHIDTMKTPEQIQKEKMQRAADEIVKAFKK